MLQRVADLPRLLQLGALQHHGENHHFAPSMLALGLKFWNTQHAIDWNLLFTISSLSLSPSHSGDLQPSDWHGKEVLGSFVDFPDWGFIESRTLSLPITGWGGPGQSYGVHQKPQGVQDLLSGKKKITFFSKWKMGLGCFMRLLFVCEISSDS